MDSKTLICIMFYWIQPLKAQKVAKKGQKIALSWKCDLILKLFYNVFSIESHFHDNAIFGFFLATFCAFKGWIQ